VSILPQHEHGSQRAPTTKKFCRSTTRQWPTGILGGLGETLDVDPNLLRLAAIFLGITSGLLPLVVTYVVAWFVVPKGQRR
jgi:phage shock protein C